MTPKIKTTASEPIVGQLNEKTGNVMHFHRNVFSNAFYQIHLQVMLMLSTILRPDDWITCSK